MTPSMQRSHEPLAEPDEQRPGASVVIATYNRGSVLFDTVRMVLENDYADFEVIVVDQTPEPTPEYQVRLAELQQIKAFEYVLLPEPSLTFARNEGLRRATGDVVIFIDDDVVLDRQFVANHVAAFDTPTVGAVAGRVVDVKYESAPAQGPVGRLLPDGSPSGNFSALERQEVDYGRGCNMSFRRSALLEVDLCDERYIGGFYREDSDIFARVKRAGYHVMFEPSTSLDHLESDGGSRTDRGTRDLRRQHSVFHNETLFFLSCVDGGSFVQFSYRMLRWSYAIKQVKGYTWKEWAYIMAGYLEGIRSYYLRHPHHLSLRHGME